MLSLSLQRRTYGWWMAFLGFENWKRPRILMREFSDSFMGDGCWVRSASDRSARAKENDVDQLLVGSKRSWQLIGRCLLEH
jgi:hypothetical protein